MIVNYGQYLALQKYGLEKLSAVMGAGLGFFGGIPAGAALGYGAGRIHSYLKDEDEKETGRRAKRYAQIGTLAGPFVGSGLGALLEHREITKNPSTFVQDATKNVPKPNMTINLPLSELSTIVKDPNVTSEDLIKRLNVLKQKLPPEKQKALGRVIADNLEDFRKQLESGKPFVF